MLLNVRFSADSIPSALTFLFNNLWLVTSLPLNDCGCFCCRSPKMDRIVSRAARHTQPVNQVRRSAVHHRDPPALNGVGNQTNGRRHRTRGLAARSLHLETNPPIAQRKSPRTIPPRLADVLFRVTLRDQVDRRLPS